MKNIAHIEAAVEDLRGSVIAMKTFINATLLLLDRPRLSSLAAVYKGETDGTRDGLLNTMHGDKVLVAFQREVTAMEQLLQKLGARHVPDD